MWDFVIHDIIHTYIYIKVSCAFVVLVLYCLHTDFHLNLICIFIRQRAQADEMDGIKKHIKSSKDKEDAKPLDKPEQ